MSQRQILSVIGAALVILGVFSPVQKFDGRESVIFLQAGGGELFGFFVLGLAAACLFLAAKDEIDWLRVGSFVLSVSISVSLIDNFRDLRALNAAIDVLQSFGAGDGFGSGGRMQFGWGLLLVGVGLLLAAALHGTQVRSVSTQVPTATESQNQGVPPKSFSFDSLAIAFSSWVLPERLDWRAFFGLCVASILTAFMSPILSATLQWSFAGLGLFYFFGAVDRGLKSRRLAWVWLGFVSIALIRQFVYVLGMLEKIEDDFDEFFNAVVWAAIVFVVLGLVWLASAGWLWFLNRKTRARQQEAT